MREVLNVFVCCYRNQPSTPEILHISRYNLQDIIDYDIQLIQLPSTFPAKPPLRSKRMMKNQGPETKETSEYAAARLTTSSLSSQGREWEPTLINLFYSVRSCVRSIRC